MTVTSAAGVEADRRVALLFPGQGAQSAAMFDAVENHPAFPERYELICDTAGVDVRREADAGRADFLDANLLSSLMTVLVSTLSLDRWKAQEPSLEVAGVAGYSVGQWAAIYAAQMLDFEALVGVVAERARLMDACAEAEPGAMCAVIGLPEATIEALLQDLRQAGRRVFISNHNCVGQVSIAGTRSGIEAAEEKLLALRPRRLLRLPVSGAWHCPLLDPAADGFAEVLWQQPLEPAQTPVVDNVTGAWLPTDQGPLRESLVRHVNHPVRWEAGVRTLLAAGCTEFVELGHGNTLTKFGLFIDRHVAWRAFA